MSAPASGFQALASLPLSVLVPLLGLPALFIGLFVIFVIRCVRHGMPLSPRMDKLAASRLVPRLILEYGYWLLQMPVRTLVALRVTPNAITVASLGLAVAAGVLFGDGRIAAAGWLVFASHTFDAFDGMVARATGVASDRGEYFDAVIDRYADFAIYLGLMWFFHDQPIPLALAVASLVGSSVMGYAKAKGEAVGIDPNVGWMARHERGAVLGFTSVLSPILSPFFEPGAAETHQYPLWAALLLIALFSNITAVLRARFVMARMPLAKR